MNIVLRRFSIYDEYFVLRRFSIYDEYFMLRRFSICDEYCMLRRRCAAQACTLARRTAETFLKYVNRSVHTLGMQASRNPEAQVKGQSARVIGLSYLGQVIGLFYIYIFVYCHQYNSHAAVAYKFQVHISSKI